MSESSPAPGDREPLTVDDLAAECRESEDFIGRTIDCIEDRIIRMEELVAARWPRSMFLRRRLARELRASIAGISEATAPGVGTGFRTRRAEAAGQAVIWESVQERRGG